MLPAFSVVIPAFNEAIRIGGTLGTTIEYLEDASPDSEIIVVNDGSTDGTGDVVRQAFAEHKFHAVRLFENFPNRGKGAAVRKALLASTKAIGTFFDADLSTPIEELPKIIQPIAAGGIDLAFGSRALDRKLIGNRQPWRREQAGRVFNLIVRLATGLPFGIHNADSKHFGWHRVARFWRLPESTVLVSTLNCFYSRSAPG